MSATTHLRPIPYADAVLIAQFICEIDEVGFWPVERIDFLWRQLQLRCDHRGQHSPSTDDPNETTCDACTARIG
jgi:hypothetical protein